MQELVFPRQPWGEGLLNMNARLIFSARELCPVKEQGNSWETSLITLRTVLKFNVDRNYN